MFFFHSIEIGAVWTIIASVYAFVCFRDQSIPIQFLNMDDFFTGCCFYLSSLSGAFTEQCLHK